MRIHTQSWQAPIGINLTLVGNRAIEQRLAARRRILSLALAKAPRVDYCGAMQSRSRLDTLRAWATACKRDSVALWLAARDPRVPLAAKIAAGLVAGYALSPIDLIPDFIPVIGYLDDIVLVPLGLLLAVRLVPPALMAEFRAAALAREAPPLSYAAAGVILSIWLAGAALTVAWLWSHWRAI